MTASPLTDAEYNHLSSVLNRFRDDHAMNLEELDGFLAALICGPAHVHPSDYLPRSGEARWLTRRSSRANSNSKIF
jgi:uncharacterized protein